MKISYDAMANAAYIYLVDAIPGSAVRTYVWDSEEVEGQINLDFDSKGRLLGIEILNAIKILPESLLKSSPPG